MLEERPMQQSAGGGLPGRIGGRTDPLLPAGELDNDRLPPVRVRQPIEQRHITVEDPIQDTGREQLLHRVQCEMQAIGVLVDLMVEPHLGRLGDHEPRLAECLPNGVGDQLVAEVACEDRRPAAGLAVPAEVPQHLHARVCGVLSGVAEAALQAPRPVAESGGLRQVHGEQQQVGEVRDQAGDVGVQRLVSREYGKIEHKSPLRAPPAERLAVRGRQHHRRSDSGGPRLPGHGVPRRARQPRLAANESGTSHPGRVDGQRKLRRAGKIRSRHHS